MSRSHISRGFAFILVAFAFLNVVSATDSPSPFLGKWVLNIQKSNFGTDTPLKSNVFSVTDPGDGLWHSIIDFVDGDTNTHLEYTTAGDGKPVPVTGTSDVDSVVVTKVDDSTVKFAFKKNGKRVQWSMYRLSKSGKTLSGPIAGVEPDGKTWKWHYVFDRQ
jgi:hypothetical protein